MTVNEVKQFVSNMITKEVKAPVLLIGATGIGKSWSMKEVAKEMSEEGTSVGFVDLRLATQEVTDLIGIPRTTYVDKSNPDRIVAKEEITSGSFKGQFEPRTLWTKPGWWPKEGSKGILALEEVNRAPEDVRQAIFQLLTEWKLHTHKLPDGWAIVSLINPDNGAYHVNQLDPAFKRRFIQLVVTPPDAMDWCIWAKKNKVDDRVITFVAQFPKHLGKDEDISIDAFPTRAGYHMLANLLQASVIPDKCIHEVASGIIGIDSATVFTQSLKGNMEKPISAEQVIKEYDKVQEHHQKLIKAKRADLLYCTMVDVIATIDSADVKGYKADELKNIHDYLIDCPAETLTNIILRMNDRMLERLSKFNDLAKRASEIKRSVSEI
jgi:hypothetical protein